MRAVLWSLVVIPVMDFWLLIEIGRAIGAGRTLLLMLLIAAAGLALIRRLGVATLLRARQRLAAGEPPNRELLDAALLTLGGVLLVIPGFLTDGMAIFCLLPALRRRWVQRLFTGAGGQSSANVIEGEYRRDD